MVGSGSLNVKDVLNRYRKMASTKKSAKASYIPSYSTRALASMFFPQKAYLDNYSHSWGFLSYENYHQLGVGYGSVVGWAPKVVRL